jgi:hydrogenase maturation factor
MSKNNKKNKRVKTQKDIKSVEERTQIVVETIAKLVEVSLAAVDDNDTVYSAFEGIQEFIKILEEYKKPTLLSGFSGVIKVPELKRNIEYILPLRQMIAHGVRLVSEDAKDYQV